MADRVGFEPTVPLRVHLISSQGRYNHFDTCPDRAARGPLRYYDTSFPLLQVFFPKRSGSAIKKRKLQLDRKGVACYYSKADIVLQGSMQV